MLDFNETRDEYLARAIRAYSSVVPVSNANMHLNAVELVDVIDLMHCALYRSIASSPNLAWSPFSEIPVFVSLGEGHQFLSQDIGRAKLQMLQFNIDPKRVASSSYRAHRCFRAQVDRLTSARSSYVQLSGSGQVINAAPGLRFVKVAFVSNVGAPEFVDFLSSEGRSYSAVIHAAQETIGRIRKAHSDGQALNVLRDGSFSTGPITDCLL